jgi:tetratricopeptide (TPR) repeat protein
MAKKKGGPRKGPKATSRPSPKRTDPPAGLPTREALEAILREMAGGLFDAGAAPDTPLGRAELLLDRAASEPDRAGRVRLAREALELCPDCADAYALLAAEASSPRERLDYYERAVAAGERAIGPEAFREGVGHFWGLLTTRPYMRAREGLAHALWGVGRREEAAGHVREMLRLNPNDNQGLRYILASWLLNLDRDDEVAGLLEAYPEGSATWAYTAALVAFRREGDTPASRRLLKAARAANRYVPAYLLQDEPLPAESPPYYSPGDRAEAAIYAVGGLSAWRSMPGALTWLGEAVRVAPRRRKAAGPKAAGPSAIGVARLNRLPREFDTWQADSRPMPRLVEEGGRLVQPWITLVVSRTRDLILGQAMSLEPPTAAQLWDVLAAAMAEARAGEPHRPTTLQVRPGPAWDELRPHLAEIGVECESADTLDQVDLVMEDLTEHMREDGPPGLLAMPGVTPERVARFYEAAAAFYREAPWRLIGYEEAIRVDCDRRESGPWYAMVMGQSGMTVGVALYEDLALLRHMWAGDLDDEEGARRTVALTVTFDPERDLPTADILAARAHGWEVAGPEAYPVALRKEPGLVMRPPLAPELELLEACLRAIPAFVAGQAPRDATPRAITVPVATGELTLSLRWIGEDD